MLPPSQQQQFHALQRNVYGLVSPGGAPPSRIKSSRNPQDPKTDFLSKVGSLEQVESASAKDPNRAKNRQWLIAASVCCLAGPPWGCAPGRADGRQSALVEMLRVPGLSDPVPFNDFFMREGTGKAGGTPSLSAEIEAARRWALEVYLTVWNLSAV